MLGIEEETAMAGHRLSASDLNENAVEAINAWCAAMIGRWGHKYFGALQHAHADFTGVDKHKRERKSFRWGIKNKLSECQMKRIINFDPDDLGQAIEFQDEKAIG